MKIKYMKKKEKINPVYKNVNVIKKYVK